MLGSSNCSDEKGNLMSSTAPVSYIEAITQRYASLGYDPYRWYHADSEPVLKRPAKPVSESRLGVLSTAGAYVAGQVAYHYKDDTSVREIPKQTSDADMRFAHITENYLESPRKDPNCILPLNALRRLESEGQIGEVAENLLSCMGGVYSQRRVREELIPAVEAHFKREAVDLALLIPM